MEATPIRLIIVPPTGDIRTILDAQHCEMELEFRSTIAPEFDSFFLLCPLGTQREYLGKGQLATFWLLTFPGGRTLIEIHVSWHKNQGQSVLIDADPQRFEPYPAIAPAFARTL